MQKTSFDFRRQPLLPLEQLVLEHYAPSTGIGWIACPSPAVVLAPRPLRHTPCCALLLTAQRTVWMLLTQGHLWTEARLMLAAQGLAELDEPSVRDARVAVHLAARLGLPGVRVLNPVLPRVDPAQWEIRRLAAAWAMRAGAWPRGTSSDTPKHEDVKTVERRIRARLAAAMRRFVERLDGQVLAAVPHCLEDIDVYNYLAYRPRQRNRLQFASTFPLFLRAAATAGRDGVGAPIRAAVDAGVPIVRMLAKHWSVSPGVIRCLLHKPADLVGRRWEADPVGLARILNALPAELRPGPDPSAWTRFNRFIGLAESAFGRDLLDSLIGLAWLRHAARHGWKASVFSQAGLAGDAKLVQDVHTVRRALLQALAAEVAVPSGERAAAPDVEARIAPQVDTYLAALSPRRLMESARRYRREFELAMARLSEDVDYLRGRRFWPLLPEDYISRDGQRRVRSLTSVDSLARHGAALKNCLARQQLPAFAEACRQGKTYVLAIMDTRTNTTLSAAEIRPIAGEPSLGFQVRQHEAIRNMRPSAECQKALAEVMLLLSTPPVRAHLAAGVRARRQRETLAARLCGRPTADTALSPPAGEVSRYASALAVRTAIGERRFAELLMLSSRVCAAPASR